MPETNAPASITRFFETINGNVTVSMLPGMKAQTLFWEMTRHIGPSIIKVFEALERDQIARLQSGDASGVTGIAAATEMLCSKLTKQEFEYIRRELLALVHYEGQPISKVADLIFQGKTFTLWRVLAFAIEVNYLDFFDAARVLAASFLVKRTPSSENSPNESPQLGLVGG